MVTIWTDSSTNLPHMNSGIAEALIGVSGVVAGGIIGVGGSWLGAHVNSRSADRTTRATIEGNSQDIKAQIEASEATTKAQIESAMATVTAQIGADRQSRIWDKRAAVYVKAVRLFRYQQEIRESQVQHLLTAADASTELAPVDRQVLEALMTS
ncbi:MAG TPA: hypothetical protein VMA32_06660 [Streptosporangiaceae bacterium]|nr:hypothetical protein [Streptosporangiaceae bacterium]